MSDRIVLMNEGRFEQIGTPGEIYDHPKTSFVARFIGTANIFSGQVKRIEGGLAEIETPAGLCCCLLYTSPPRRRRNPARRRRPSRPPRSTRAKPSL